MYVTETTTVDTDTRRKFTSPEARTHEQDYGEHFDTGCMYVGSQIVNYLF